MIPIYLLTLLGFFIAGIFLHRYNKLRIFENKKHLLSFIVVIFIVGTIWDYFSVSLKIWIFPGNGLMGLRIGILPLEEYIFFLVVPYFGLTVFKALEKMCKK